MSLMAMVVYWDTGPCGNDGKEVPRLIVQKLLKELDPEGSKHRSFYSLSNKNKFFINDLCSSPVLWLAQC